MVEPALKTKHAPDDLLRLDIVEKIHGMIMKNRRMKVREIAEVVGISTERVHNILHEKLHVKKLGAAIAYSRLKMHAKGRFNAVFGDV